MYLFIMLALRKDRYSIIPVTTGVGSFVSALGFSSSIPMTIFMQDMLNLKSEYWNQEQMQRNLNPEFKVPTYTPHGKDNKPQIMQSKMSCSFPSKVAIRL